MLYEFVCLRLTRAFLISRNIAVVARASQRSCGSKRFAGDDLNRSLSTIRVNESARTRLSFAGDESSAAESCFPTTSPSNAKVWTKTDSCAARMSSRSRDQNSLKFTSTSIPIADPIQAQTLVQRIDVS